MFRKTIFAFFSMVSILEAKGTEILYHKGGVVYKVIAEMEAYERPIKVVKDGLCGSSCTYIFNFPDTCVSRKANILFHAPRDPDGNIMDGWADIISENYNKKLKEFTDISLYSGKDYWVSGEQMIELYGIKECK